MYIDFIIYVVEILKHNFDFTVELRDDKNIIRVLMYEYTSQRNKQ